jgi:putative ABC transport system substrate-binding protein
MKKKLFALALAACMTLSLAACGSSSAPSTAAASAAASAATSGSAATSAASTSAGKTYTIGICQLVQHPALDAATQGFEDALKEKLGDAVTFDLQNAAGDTAACATICSGFAASKVDLIMANATPALQAAATATNTIPILGTSVTDYATALSISDWKGTTGKNISGTSDLAPLDGQAEHGEGALPQRQDRGHPVLLR